MHTIFQPNGGRIALYLLQCNQNFIFGFLVIKPDSDKISIFEAFISHKSYSICQPSWMYKPCIKFETYISGFLEPESPSFYLNHAFLSSIEAEIITFLPKKAAILFFLLLLQSCKYNVAPLPELIVRPQRPFIPKVAFIRSTHK